MKNKNKGAYFCQKCGYEHKLQSKIGKKHKKYKKRGIRKTDVNKLSSRLEKIEKSLKKSSVGKANDYYCKKCERSHKKGTKIEKKHKKHKKKTKLEKRKEKFNFLKDISEIFKNKEKTEEKIEHIKSVENISKRIIVKDIMVRNPVHVKITSTLSSAFEIMKKYNLESIIVTEKKIPIGILNYEEILSFFSSFIRMEKGSLEEKKHVLDDLSEQDVSAAMIRINDSVSPTDSLELAIKKLISNKLSQIPVVNGSGEIIGILTLENIFSFISKEEESRNIITSSKIETGIDKLFDLIKIHEKISAKEAAKKMKSAEKQVEDWAKILESHGLIEIDYSKIGTIILIKKEKNFF